MTSRTRSGFTLMESVIAIGVVAVLLTTFLAVFGPASQNIRRAISIQDADRLQSALDRELHLLRESEAEKFDTSFAKAFDWILNSGDEDTAVFLYNYRGNPSSVRSDGTLDAYTGTGGQSGRDFVVQPAVRRLGDDDSTFQEDLEAIEGPLFLVRMTQLVFEDGALVVGEGSGKIVNPHNTGEGYSDAEKFPEAVIAFNAEFYALRSNTFKYIEEFLKLEDGNNDGRPDVLGRPLFTRNMGARR